MSTRRFANEFLTCLILFLSAVFTQAGAKDTPFWQDRSHKFTTHPQLVGAKFLKLERSRDGVVYVLTDRGIARLFQETLALDQSFRALAALKPIDISTDPTGDLYYLYPKAVLSNGKSGSFHQFLPEGHYSTLAVSEKGIVYLSGPKGYASVVDGKLYTNLWSQIPASGSLKVAGDDLYIHSGKTLWRWDGRTLLKLGSDQPSNITTIALQGNEAIIGTTNGFSRVHRQTGQSMVPLVNRLPSPHITHVLPTAQGLWFGSPRGAFRLREDGTDYYASGRWLTDDRVMGLCAAENGSVFVLTAAGLCKIEYYLTTLAEKAAVYEKKIRERHIRFGFCSELLLSVPGDITSAQMIDTDNDGMWTEYYLASQAFHFGATGDETARRNAWETFAVMERLESINGLDGFPSRSYERLGFRYSDPDRWHERGDGVWEWKGTTSSDEIAAHLFGISVLWETCAKTETERNRIRRWIDRVIGHIVRNNYYLIDIDGKPTLWGRWHPEYVNSYPPGVGDRRLNSSQMIGFLQFAFHVTGKELYRTKAFELIEKNGYLDSIRNSLKLIASDTKAIHQGIQMGDVWNHSDDLLGFDSYWNLYRYAFNKDIRNVAQFAAKDHWEIEIEERNPLWTGFYVANGGKNPDVKNALWTLRRFPLDLIDWRVQNSHRLDITKLAPNFRGRELQELLPPSERVIMRWNGHPFVLDGGSGGHSELAGDEFLLPYWMVRYLKIID